jgi:hypothetical protein
MDFTGKPMKSMIYVSAIGTDSDQRLATWVESAVKLARGGATRKCPSNSRGGVALLLQVWALADQRLQSQCPSEWYGSGIEALLVITGLVIERAGQRHILFSTQGSRDL